MLSHLRILPYFETFLFILRTFSVLPNVTAPKSNPSKYTPVKLDFIHRKWISPVEDGFDCVFSAKDNTLSRGIYLFLPFLGWKMEG